ncbi:hypothetical protein HAX54_042857 [Datura stramonium]|uniref:Uncharacterized protein n=1 Tax=Datura stramonium TaxID=4076 RepID=A0ABS8SMU7_DATST|nr:hypothetical protein [Datura stramonium]
MLSCSEDDFRGLKSKMGCEIWFLVQLYLMRPHLRNFFYFGEVASMEVFRFYELKGFGEVRFFEAWSLLWPHSCSMRFASLKGAPGSASMEKVNVSHAAPVWSFASIEPMWLSDSASVIIFCFSELTYAIGFLLLRRPLGRIVAKSLV